MGLIYGSFFGACMAWILMCIHFNRQVQKSFDKSVLVENLKYGFQVVPKALTRFVNKFFDKYMLNSMVSMSSAGLYNIGQQITNVCFALMSNVWQAFQPVYYREVFDNGEGASKTVGRLFSIFSYITLFPIILGALFAQEIVYIMFPSSYYGAVDIIIILSVGITTQTFGMYVGVQFAYSKRPFWIFPVSVAGTLINVILNIYLIPKYGLIGAGLATVASVSSVNLILTYIGQKLYKIQYEWKAIAPLFVSTIGAITLIMILKKANVDYIYLCAVKAGCLATLVYIYIKAGMFSRKSIQKLKMSFWNYSEKGIA